MPTVREAGAASNTGGFLSRVSWGSLLLGVVVAIGVMMLLTLLGLALGFTAIDPMHDEEPMAGIAVGTGIYAVLVHIISLGIGGYAAARLGSSAWNSAVVLHGAAVWALVGIFSVAAAITTVGAVISGTANMVGTIAGGVAQPVRAMMPEDIAMPDFETLFPDDFANMLPPEARQELEERDMTPEDLEREGRAIIQELISEEDWQRARQAITQALTTIIQNPTRAGEEIEQLFNRLTDEQEGLITERDREQAMQALEERLGIQREDAEDMIAEWQQAIEDATGEAQTALNDLQREAAEVAQQVTDTIASAAWWGFIVSLLGLIAAIGGAVFGRPVEDAHAK